MVLIKPLIVSLLKCYNPSRPSHEAICGIAIYDTMMIDMAELEVGQIYLHKAEQSLAGAESEFINGRYNNTANRCYYACFQAAIFALLQARIQPSGPQWGHEFVQGRFVGYLINRRKLYPAGLRQTLSNTLGLRQTADYGEDDVNQREAAWALRWTRPFIEAVQGGGERI